MKVKISIDLSEIDLSKLQIDFSYDLHQRFPGDENEKERSVFFDAMEDIYKTIPKNRITKTNYEKRIVIPEDVFYPFLLGYYMKKFDDSMIEIVGLNGTYSRTNQEVYIELYEHKDDEGNRYNFDFQNKLSENNYIQKCEDIKKIFRWFFNSHYLEYNQFDLSSLK